MVRYEEMELGGEREQYPLLKTVLTVERGETPEQAFGQLVQVIYAWIKARGGECGGLEVSAIASSELHEKLIACLISFIQEEEPLREFFLQIGRVSFKLGESEDEELSEFNIVVDSGEQTRAAA